MRAPWTTTTAALLLAAGCIPLEDPATLPMAAITPRAPGANPLSGVRFYVAPDAKAKQQGLKLRALGGLVVCQPIACTGFELQVPDTVDDSGNVNAVCREVDCVCHHIFSCVPRARR